MKVKVWNDNKHPYKETFRGVDYRIPAGQFIELEYDEAFLLKGSFTPIVRDADGQPVPEYFKMLRIEEPVVSVEKTTQVNPLLCQSCRYLGKDQRDLLEHLKSHADQIVVDDEAEAEIAKKRGRPKKEAESA